MHTLENTVVLLGLVLNVTYVTNVNGSWWQMSSYGV